VREQSGLVTGSQLAVQVDAGCLRHHLLSYRTRTALGLTVAPVAGTKASRCLPIMPT
jgi:hypothetical protein